MTFAPVSLRSCCAAILWLCGCHILTGAENKKAGGSDKPFVLWAAGCSHVHPDRNFGNESLTEAIRQSEFGGPEGAPSFAWDIMVHLGDLCGGALPPDDAMGKEVIRQFSSAKKHSLAQIYNILGNHDGSGPLEETQWWWKKWIDPAGENSAVSGVHNDKRLYPVKGTWERYSFQVGNILFLMMGDRNDGGPPMGRAAKGGYPAGRVTMETFNWWKAMVAENKDKIIITCHHHMLCDTTVGSGQYEGIQTASWKEGPQTPYHGKDGDDLSNKGASYLLWVGDEANQAFENYFKQNPGAISLWLGGHTHTFPDDVGRTDQGHRPKTHVEEKWGVTFVNCAALSSFNRPRQKFPMSRLLTFNPGQNTVRIQCYMHSEAYKPTAGFGWYDKVERTVKLKNTFGWQGK